MRLRSMIIFGAGYLCGTRAGRDRYKQIAESVRGLAESDVVRSYVDRAMDVAKRPLATVVPEMSQRGSPRARTWRRTPRRGSPSAQPPAAARGVCRAARVRG